MSFAPNGLNFQPVKIDIFFYTPGPHIMWILLVQNSTSARLGKNLQYSLSVNFVWVKNCEIQLMQLFSSPKNGIMRGPGVHLLTHSQKGDELLSWSRVLTVTNAQDGAQVKTVLEQINVTQFFFLFSDVLFLWNVKDQILTEFWPPSSCSRPASPGLLESILSTESPRLRSF